MKSRDSEHIFVGGPSHQDCEELADRYSRRGFAYASSALDLEKLNEILAVLESSHEWGMVTCRSGRMLGAPPADYQAYSPSEKRALLEDAYLAANNEFSCFREKLWSHDNQLVGEANSCENLRADTAFGDQRFAGFLSAITKEESVSLVDIEVTRYSWGHFSSFSNFASDDGSFDVIVGLSPDWFLDWGGLIEIRDHLGSVERAYSPEMGNITVVSRLRPWAISHVNDLALRPANFINLRFATSPQ
ncbi:MAG: hypothetical protein AAF351_12040 [Pseudomonadota bacterium]